MKKEIAATEQQEVLAEAPMLANAARLAQLREAVDQTKAKIEEEKMTKRSYAHMLQRMGQDYIATKIKSADLQKSLQTKKEVLDLEEGKQRKSKEERLQSKSIFDNLMKNIEKEQRDRQDRIIELQKCIDNKEQSVRRRIERQRKNQEIAETAANESKDSSELKMRYHWYINKLWNNFMRKKMEREMKASQTIDDAFKQIKTATGVTDVQAMVHRFKQRESTYTQLLSTVSSSEARVDELKRNNEELGKRLHDIQIDAGDAVGGGPESQDSEIIQMNSDLGEVANEQAKLVERFKRINIVNDQISKWASRVYTKFGVLTEDAAFQKEPSELPLVFETMNALVSKELQAAKERQEHDGAGDDADFAETFNDFATEDFINKNIRVRPVSGVTHADDTKDGRASSINRGLVGGGDGGNEGDDENFNKIAMHELTNARDKIKDEFRLAEEAARKRQAQLEKEKQRK